MTDTWTKYGPHVVPLRTLTQYYLGALLGRAATPYETREVMVLLWPELEAQMLPVPKDAFYDSCARLCVRSGNRAYVIDNSPWWLGPREFDIE